MIKSINLPEMTLTEFPLASMHLTQETEAKKKKKITLTINTHDTDFLSKQNKSMIT